MAKLHAAILASVAIVFCAAAGFAQQPIAFTPAPPGTLVQSQPVALGGETAAGQWRAIASNRLVGAANGTKFYQWYLSIYALRRGAYRLRYQSPGNGGPLARVTQASGGVKMWFPVQDLQIVGAARLMQPGVQQLVVRSHEAGADCGAGTVSVFASGPAGSVVPAVSVYNPCELKATILTGQNALLLAGPYYAADAAMCCPTKTSASAVLRYHDGKWSESPNYYKLFIGKLPPA